MENEFRNPPSLPLIPEHRIPHKVHASITCAMVGRRATEPARGAAMHRRIVRVADGNGSVREKRRVIAAVTPGALLLVQRVPEDLAKAGLDGFLALFD